MDPIAPRKRAFHPVVRLAFHLALAALIPASLGAVRLPLASYSTEDGLASDTVERIRQDSAGRLWFACREGLSRFDGEIFASYGTEDGLPDPRTHDLLESRDGRFWVATAGGLAVLDPTALPRASFVAVPLPGEAPGSEVEVLAQDGDGRLWVGTAGGLFVAAAGEAEKGANAAFRRVSGVPGPVRDLVLGPGGRPWAAAGAGLWREGGREGGRKAGQGETASPWESVPLPDGTPSPWRLLWEGEEHLWVGHGEGGLVLGANGEPLPTPHPLVDFGTWTGLARGHDGRVWIAGAGGLLASTPRGHQSLGAPGEPESLTLFTEAEGLTGRQLTAATTDRDGNLWLGTEGRGILRLIRGGLLTYTAADGLAHPRIAAIFEGPEGRLYVSSGDNRFLHVFDGERFSAVSLNLPQAASSTAWGWNQVTLRGQGGDWWVPTGHGLFRFEGDRPWSELAAQVPKAVYTREDGLAGDNLFRLYEDRQGDLWIGSFGPGETLTRWRRSDGSLTRFGSRQGAPAATPSAFAEDGDGNLWIGFDDGSLVRRRPGRNAFERITLGPGRFADFIYDLFVDSTGRLWVATSQAGLLRVEEVRWGRLRATVWTTAEGLVANTVFSLAEDSRGHLYLGTPRGVQRLSPATGALISLTTAAGLASNVVTVAYRDRTGDLWFGSLEGLSRLIPEDGEVSPAPTVLLRRVVVGGLARPVPELGVSRLPALRLGTRRPELEVEFRATSFRAGERLRYQYRLGEEEAWSPVEGAGRLALTRLPVGVYPLQIRALRSRDLAETALRTGAGEATTGMAILPLEVVAPLWRRGWFLGLAVLLLAIGAYAAPRLRLGRLLAAERVRTRIASHLHDDLGSNLARISVVSEVLGRRIEGDEETRRLLASVGETAREVSDALDDSIWAIDPRRDDLLSLVARLRGFAADLFSGEDLSWRLEAPAAASPTSSFPLPPEIRRHLFLIGKEAITNVARHARARSVVIEIGKTGSSLTLEVRDDGRGLEPEEPAAAAEPAAEAGGRHRESGYGLPGMERRARQLGGELRIDSAPGKGTRVHLSVPVGPRTRLQRMFMRFSNGR